VLPLFLLLTPCHQQHQRSMWSYSLPPWVRGQWRRRLPTQHRRVCRATSAAMLATPPLPPHPPASLSSTQPCSCQPPGRLPWQSQLGSAPQCSDPRLHTGPRSGPHPPPHTPVHAVRAMESLPQWWMTGVKQPSSACLPPPSPRSPLPRLATARSPRKRRSLAADRVCLMAPT
jgi:hypothetical protein